MSYVADSALFNRTNKLHKVHISKADCRIGKITKNQWKGNVKNSLIRIAQLSHLSSMRRQGSQCPDEFALF